MAKKKNPDISKRETVLDRAPWFVERLEGREGQTTEYVEFLVTYGKKVDRHFIAQGGNGHGAWFVYEVWPGRKGRTRTMAQYPGDGIKSKVSAVMEAKTLANFHVHGGLL